MTTSEEIKRRLWDGANELRGSMGASRYKDCMLGRKIYLMSINFVFIRSRNIELRELMTVCAEQTERFVSAHKDRRYNFLATIVDRKDVFLKSGEVVHKIAEVLERFRLIETIYIR